MHLCDGNIVVRTWRVSYRDGEAAEEEEKG